MFQEGSVDIYFGALLYSKYHVKYLWEGGRVYNQVLTSKFHYNLVKKKGIQFVTVFQYPMNSR